MSRFPIHQQSIFKFGLATLAAGLFGACIFKDRVKTITRTLLQSSEATAPKPLASLKDRIDSPKTELSPLLSLFVDINRTIVIYDSAKKELTIQQMAAAALSESTVGIWDDKHGKMTHRHYVYTVLIPDTAFADKTQLKQERQREIYGFIDYLIKSNHPAKDRVLKKYHKIIKKSTNPSTGEIQHKVFDSFYSLLEKLRKCHINFVVILMTFGEDLTRVAEEIGKHPSGVKFTQYGAFHNKQLHLENGETLTTTDAIFKAFLTSGLHFALKTNWKEWNEDGERGRSGKPFIYDSSGNMHGIRNLSLFCDDNITHDDEKDIVAPIDVAGRSHSRKELADQLVKVDVAKAPIAKNYFIKETANCLLKHGYTDEYKKMMSGIRVKSSSALPIS